MYDEGRDEDVLFGFPGRGVAGHSSVGVRGEFDAIIDCIDGEPAWPWNEFGGSIPGCGRMFRSEGNGAPITPIGGRSGLGEVGGGKRGVLPLRPLYGIPGIRPFEAFTF